MNSEIGEMLDQVWSFRRDGNYEAANELLDEAEVSCSNDDYFSRGRILHIRAQFEADAGNFEKAVSLEKKSHKTYIKTGDANRIAHSARHVADYLRRGGHDSESEHFYQIAMDNYEMAETASEGNIANALRGFAKTLDQLGKKEAAIDTWRRARDLYGNNGIAPGVEEAEAEIERLSS